MGRADTDEQTPCLLLAADHLESWAETLPCWSESGQEPRYVFLERRFEAETEVIERLHRAPRRRLNTCPARMHFEQSLGGLSVGAKQGLAAALREWAGRARERVGY